MLSTTRFAAAVLTAAVTMTVTALPAFAAAADDEPRNQIVITGRVDVPQGDVVARVFIVDGDVRVDGRVRDWVIAVNGDVRIDGRVGGDVTAFNGRVTVAASGSVGGDVASADRPVIADRSAVAGDVDRVRTRIALGRLGTIGRVVLWIVGTVSSLVLGVVLLLVMRRGLERAARAGRDAVGPAIGLGFAVAIGTPIVGGLLAVTLVALPLGVAVLLSLALLYAVGYVTGAYFLGRLIVREPGSRWLAFIVGWAILRVAAIAPGLGALALVAATVYGLGCLTVAAARAAREPATGIELATLGAPGPDLPPAG